MNKTSTEKTNRKSATRTGNVKARKASKLPQQGPSEQFARLLFRVDRDLMLAIRERAAKDGKGIQPLMRELLAAGIK